MTEAPLDCPRELQQPVGERRLPVVDVGDDGEVTDPLRRVQAQIGAAVSGALARLGAKAASDGGVEGAEVAEHG